MQGKRPFMLMIKQVIIAPTIRNWQMQWRIYMIRQADKQDIPRIAEIIVFGKRVAYRPIFANDRPKTLDG